MRFERPNGRIPRLVPIGTFYFEMSMHEQNIVLYLCGVVLNVSAFVIVPPYLTHTKAGLGFFEGYDSTPAKLVVLFNAFIGLAISFVFKYADAVVKTFATASTTVLLVIFSSFLKKRHMGSVEPAAGGSAYVYCKTPCSQTGSFLALSCQTSIRQVTTRCVWNP